MENLSLSNSIGCELINGFMDGNIAYVIGRFELGERLGG
jgi:hypothetical protein